MNRFLLVAGLLFSSCAPALAQRLVSQTATLAAGQAVVLDLKFAQSIRVRPGTGLSVQAKVSINDNQQNDAYSLVLDKAGDELRVEEKLDDNLLRQSHFTGDCTGGNFNSNSDGVNVNRPGNRRTESGAGRHAYNYCAHIDYEVTLPAGTDLRIKTITGDLDLSALRGTIFVNTVSGNILLSALAGPVTARSVSGDVKLQQPGTAPVRAASVSGNVDASWPAGQSADLSLHTVSGEVYADPAVTFRNLQEKSYVGYELHGSYGPGGGPLVKLESVSGDVFFRKQQ
ncbi:DUF4097 family beta strand repeat-containing protein [Hymenobacter sp. H14-R3]|uniref:DUF4097 family beta strand repeat-containing protein n=1 Tax=Hymenobacter sp. H14-R3 TaxID=3046308 RepID=UPI0024B9EFB0|nr:DUF4097 family beta strand repeat-containing protein [Hymenobacter sp. H14-R3]MDJ0367836.1 DUF4097 family beta strand repeat-containing protein [Hymenobacter sp. H14-R3]